VRLNTVAGAVIGAIVGFAVVVIVWRSFESLNEWGDDHMGTACSIQLGSMLLGAIVGGFLGDAAGRRRHE
jgi:hypothetical protein